MTDWVSGDIVLGIVDLASNRASDVSLPITNWHQGVVNQDLFGSLDLKPIRLGVVGQVVEGAAAARAGLQAGDWIVGVDGEPVSRWSDWVTYIVRFTGSRARFWC